MLRLTLWRRSGRAFPPRGGALGCWTLEDDDGQWDGGALFPGPIDHSLGPGQFGEGQPWSATAYSLMLLHDFGIDPNDDRVRRAVALVKENSHWEYAGEPFFEGEVEPCINGMVLVLGAYFGQDVDGVAARLLGEQLEDGGWNCEVENGSVRSSFHTTIRVLEGLLAHERATGGLPRIGRGCDSVVRSIS